jgi:hypothetical protein
VPPKTVAVTVVESPEPRDEHTEGGIQSADKSLINHRLPPHLQPCAASSTTTARNPASSRIITPSRLDREHKRLDAEAPLDKAHGRHVTTMHTGGAEAAIPSRPRHPVSGRLPRPLAVRILLGLRRLSPVWWPTRRSPRLQTVLKRPLDRTGRDAPFFPEATRLHPTHAKIRGPARGACPLPGGRGGIAGRTIR